MCPATRTEGVGIEMTSIGEGDFDARAASDPEHVVAAIGAADDSRGGDQRDPIVSIDATVARDDRSH